MAKSLPRPQKGQQVSSDYIERLVRRLETDQPLKPLQEFLVEEPTTVSRTFDPNTATLAEVAAMLAILIRDLQGE
jgi:hypothetical protein